MSKKLVSIDFKSDFGFFRKPDLNAGIHLSYNMIHKPAVIGIFGAIIGLGGYTEKGKIPEYYRELGELKIGIEPLCHEKGNYSKTIIKYSNTIGYANKGANYLTEEATLIKPAYRCYVLLDFDRFCETKLHEYLKKGEAEYLPYFGKNEFAVWWDNFIEYGYEAVSEDENSSKNVISLMLRHNQTIKDQKQVEFDLLDLESLDKSFLYFERLPIGFDRTLNQYDLQEFAYSTFKMKTNSVQNLYLLKSTGNYVQLL